MKPPSITDITQTHPPCCHDALLLPLLPHHAGKRASGDLYAIKVMRKVDLIRKNMVQSVKNERNILAMANNPFVVSERLAGWMSGWSAAID